MKFSSINFKSVSQSVNQKQFICNYSPKNKKRQCLNELPRGRAVEVSKQT